MLLVDPALKVPRGGFRVAVVGSGPAGFYAAGQLLASDLAVEVDMIERLPTPWGLVRFGVAPDHPKIKEVSRIFERIAQQPGFRFFGNVEVGRDIGHDDLLRLYHAVVYAVGAQTDRRMGIPGEDLPGSWAATQFVAWYNGHPDFQDLPFDLSCQRAVVVGAGNVALDVMRMLALTEDKLCPTDATDQAIAAIAGSGIREIVMLARRGPAQAAFTTPELKELGELAGANVVVDPTDLALDSASEAMFANDVTAQRKLAVLRAYATRPAAGKPKSLHLRFRVSPVAILGESTVEAVEVVKNELVPDERGRIQAVPKGQHERIPCGLVLRSVGYHGTPLQGVPFDDASGRMPNREGRVLDGHSAPLPGVYCAGWIKRGPSGVIGTNKKDASETVERLLEDARAGKLGPPGTSTAEGIVELLNERSIEFVTHAGWAAIDAVERARGAARGRPRIKICRSDELLATARHPRANIGE